jgi:hypothetical protein
MPLSNYRSWDGGWDQPWYDGDQQPIPSGVPFKFPASIADHFYMVDLSKYRRTTLQIRRLGTDDSVEPGESTLNASGVWPRGQDNWFLGTGQEYLDNRFAFESVYVHSGEYPSVRTRFWKSFGINPWEEGHLTLLPAYAASVSNVSAPNPAQITTCGTYLYWSVGTSLYFVNNPKPGAFGTPTLVATFGTSIQSITSDGSRVWAACGAPVAGSGGGVYITVAGSQVAVAAATPAALPSPQGLTATQGVGTVNATNLPNGSTTWYITAVDAFGNETAYTSVTATVAGVPIELTWNANTNASSFNVYRGTAAFVTNVDSPTYTDDGSIANTTQTAPSSNGTGSTPYPATFISYAKGYLLGSTGRDLVNILASGSVSFIWEHENPYFLFTCACEVPSAILVAGYAGNVSYVGAVSPDANTYGANLAPPIWATTLPPGEQINCISYSSGSILMGTSEGIRSGTTPDSTGVFDINPVVEDPGNVLCIAAWQQYEYFGWSNYNPSETWAPNRPTVSGLGRADLSQYTTQGVPGYATDVMSTSTGLVNGVTMVNGVPYFVTYNTTPQGAISVSLWGPNGQVVQTGWIEPGWIRYGTLEPKIVVDVNFQNLPMPVGGQITFQIVNETFQVSNIGGLLLAGETSVDDPLSAGLAVGQRFMAIITLTAGAGNLQSPNLYSWITKAVVIPVRQDEILLPIIMSTEVATLQPADGQWEYNPLTEFLFLKSLEASGEPFLHSLGTDSHMCYIDQVMVGDETTTMTDDRTWINTIILVKMITLT